MVSLVINFFCAYLLIRFRTSNGSLTRAAFLSARNDVLANISIILAGLITSATLSLWPDLIVGLGIFFLNLNAAHEVYTEALKEHSSLTYASS